MTEPGSVDHLMALLERGDESAAGALFERFAQRLLALARSRLDEALRRKEDPEDVLQSVFRSFFTRKQGRQFDVNDWDSVWRILTLIIVRKCADRVEYFRAACRDVRREVGPAASDAGRDTWAGMADDPTPSEAAVVTELLEDLTVGLEDGDRNVLTLQLQSYTIPEISKQVRRSERTVSRILERVRKRLRRWQAAAGENV
jgi:RNA polymerase sigma-70 factor (ECF subfamily)